MEAAIIDPMMVIMPESLISRFLYIGPDRLDMSAYMHKMHMLSRLRKLIRAAADGTGNRGWQAPVTVKRLDSLSTSNISNWNSLVNTTPREGRYTALEFIGGLAQKS